MSRASEKTGQAALDDHLASEGVQYRRRRQYRTRDKRCRVTPQWAGTGNSNQYRTVPSPGNERTA